MLVLVIHGSRVVVVVVRGTRIIAVMVVGGRPLLAGTGITPRFVPGAAMVLVMATVTMAAVG